jgi:hypothetical protein
MELALISTILKIIELSLPTLIPIAQHMLDKGLDPTAFDWDKLYGQPLEALRAQVDASRDQP